MAITSPKNVAKRLALSLLALSSLGGCAVYGPPPGPYAYYGGDGQAVYAAPPVVYPAASVYAAPYYYGPPLGLNFSFGYRSGGWRGGGWRGGRH